ncbi:MAG: RluA family pseudouridine synthase [Hungatella sp.]
MLRVLYEDQEIIVVEKPVGMESQSNSSFAPDMVSEIKKHINKLCPTGKEPYVGVIHRLDKPVGGVMVYAKTKEAAASLSKQVQGTEMKKKYQAVLCGKPVDNVGNYVDYLLKDSRSNQSKIVEKGITGAKRAELSYRVLKTKIWQEREVALVEVSLMTGRHHQIRVQFAAHGTPLWGDNRYNSEFCGNPVKKRYQIALAACELTFTHPGTGRIMMFTAEPKGEAFSQFAQDPGEI